MTKAIAVAALWISVVRSRARYYLHHFKLLAASETTDIPGVTIRIRWGKWLHYYTVNAVADKESK